MAAKKETPPPTTTAIVKKDTAAVRFTNSIISNFNDYAGLPISLTPHQKTLAQHLFQYLDKQFTELEKKRTSSERPPIIWQNINLQKLALDSVNVVRSGLDAMMKNYLNGIPYLNGRTKLYDVDLRPGYEGIVFYTMNVALHPIKTMRHELVYANDKFLPLKKSEARSTETFIHEIPSPFDRGPVTGGYGYVEYEDPQYNQLIIVKPEDFKKAQSASKDGSFWQNWTDEMKYKTVVYRTCSKVPKDPNKADTVTAFDSLEPSIDDSLLRIEDNSQAALTDAPVIDIEPIKEPDQAPFADDPTVEDPIG